MIYRMPLLTNYQKFSALPMPARGPLRMFPVQPQAGPTRLARLFGAVGISTPARPRIFAPLGMAEFMPHGEFFYNGDMPDDWSFTLPVIEHGGFGVVVVGDDDERAEFTIKADGTVNIIQSSANVVANSTHETMTLDVAPGGAGWLAGDTITGGTSGQTCVIVTVASGTSYTVRNRSGAFTDGEILSNGVEAADQGAGYPTFAVVGEDGMFNIGTSVASPCEIKNRLGVPYGAMARVWYN